VKVLFTGGTGDVGRTAVDLFIREGHRVRVIGRRSEMEVPGGEYRRCDVSDYNALLEACRGMDAIVHLAAYRGPGMAPNQEIFRVNCGGTFNVYTAAAEVGIRRVVTASSINAFGNLFGVRRFPLQYFPVEEEHPTYTSDVYSYSKEVTESLGDYFWRRDRISGAALRIPGVYEATEERLKRLKERIARSRDFYARLFHMSNDEKVEYRRRLYDGVDRFRDDRGFEKRLKVGEYLQEDEVAVFFSSRDLWTMLDARDSAQAFHKATVGDYEGSHTLFVNDSHNTVGVPSADLARLYYPEVPEDRIRLEGTETLVSIDRARSLLGFEPEYSLSRFF
jgi:nucleoside-diphosphate-sugar epimerase